ncbi:Testican-3 [Trichinella pseudospiralis]|uniref:Testican-3 n=1 Tax=Trichinella pseudospiralis TaxID=6337 RepID=A0A0V1F8Z2_TRIPS|nr:Testican-3 [Trichinella pseudospiralis]
MATFQQDSHRSTDFKQIQLPKLSDDFFCKIDMFLMRKKSPVLRRFGIFEISKRYLNLPADIFGPVNRQRCMERLALISSVHNMELSEKVRWAVLVPLAVVDNVPSILVTVRSSRMSIHRGHISFPGGRVEPSDASIVDAALREAYEEIGLSKKYVETWFAMNFQRTVISDGLVAPIICTVSSSVNVHELCINEDEVERLLVVPISELCNSRNQSYTRFCTGSGYVRPVYYVNERRQRIWGFFMAKSLRSKWCRKMRNIKRERYRIKELEKLKSVVCRLNSSSSKEVESDDKINDIKLTEHDDDDVKTIGDEKMDCEVLNLNETNPGRTTSNRNGQFPELNFPKIHSFKILEFHQLDKEHACMLIKCREDEVCTLINEIALCVTRHKANQLLLETANFGGDQSAEDYEEAEETYKHRFSDFKRLHANKKHHIKTLGPSIKIDDFEHIDKFPPKHLQRYEKACSDKQLITIEALLLKWFGDLRMQSTSAVPVLLPKHHVPCNQNVGWMFGQLDGNKDGRLQYEELFSLDHDKYKNCIHHFLDACDISQDGELSLDEWCDCFQWADREKEEPPCHAARRLTDPHLLGAFIPMCDVDGFYRPEQCYEAHCWCVDKWGREFDNSKTKGPADCGQYADHTESTEEDSEDDQ